STISKDALPLSLINFLMESVFKLTVYVRTPPDLVTRAVAPFPSVTIIDPVDSIVGLVVVAWVPPKLVPVPVAPVLLVFVEF
ncbi:hypothetical protein Q8G81_35050, partial [Klebsiella pneumoniae]